MFALHLKSLKTFLFLFFIGLSAGFCASLKVLKLSSSSFLSAYRLVFALRLKPLKTSSSSFYFIIFFLFLLCQLCHDLVASGDEFRHSLRA